VRVTWTSTAILAALEVQCTVQRDQGDKSTENIGKAELILSTLSFSPNIVTFLKVRI